MNVNPRTFIEVLINENFNAKIDPKLRLEYNPEEKKIQLSSIDNTKKNPSLSKVITQIDNWLSADNFKNFPTLTTQEKANLVLNIVFINKKVESYNEKLNDKLHLKILNIFLRIFSLGFFGLTLDSIDYESEIKTLFRPQTPEQRKEFLAIAHQFEPIRIKVPVPGRPDFYCNESLLKKGLQYIDEDSFIKAVNEDLDSHTGSYYKIIGQGNTIFNFANKGSEDIYLKILDNLIKNPYAISYNSAIEPHEQFDFILKGLPLAIDKYGETPIDYFEKFIKSRYNLSDTDSIDVVFEIFRKFEWGPSSGDILMAIAKNENLRIKMKNSPFVEFLLKELFYDFRLTVDPEAAPRYIKPEHRGLFIQGKKMAFNEKHAADYIPSFFMFLLELNLQLGENKIIKESLKNSEHYDFLLSLKNHPNFETFKVGYNYYVSQSE